VSEKEIKERLEELQDYKDMILTEQKEAKIILMYSNVALQSVFTEQEILKDKLSEILDVN